MQLPQVCQMTTSNASGQLMFNIGPGVTIPFLASHRETDNVEAERQTQALPSIPSLPPPNSVPAEERSTSDTVKSGEEESRTTTLVTPAPPRPSEEELAYVGATAVHPSRNPEAPATHSIENVNINQTLRQAEEPSVSSLAIQLASVSGRQLMSGVCVAASETYIMAQRVAELGLQQLNEQLQRRGIHFDDKEKDDLKAVLLMLLIVVCAIFLLGMGKQRISNHWDFYFPN